MHRTLILLIVMTFAAASVSIGQSPDGGRATFHRWATSHAHPLTLDPLDASVRDLEPLGAIVGNARLVGFGEPFHGGHEPLLMRNRIVKYLVSSRGFSAVALETGLAKSKVLYDYVLGTRTASDSALRGAFGYGFGNFNENMELVKWLRAWNAGRVASGRVRLYGMDLTGQMTSSAAPSIEAVQSYLNRVDPDAAAQLQREFTAFLPRFSSTEFPSMTEGEQNAISGKIQDLVSTLRGHEGRYVKASSPDDFDWAVRQAMNASQDAAYLRLWPRGFRMTGLSLDSLLANARRRAPEMELMGSVRELGMVDNLAWILEREASRGRVLVFAHDLHLGRAEVAADEPLLNGHRAAGAYLAARFGSAYRVVGSYYGRAVDMPPAIPTLPPDSAGIDGALAIPSTPVYLIDLHDRSITPSLSTWFATPFKTRTGNFGEQVIRIAPSAAFDALIYFATIRPVKQ